MEAINTRLSLPTATPESPKPVTPAKPDLAQKKPETDEIRIDLSDPAREQLKQNEEKTLSPLQKAAEEAKSPPPPPPPPLGEQFYEANMAQATKSKAAREAELKKTEERLNNYAQYTNNYLAQVAYAKTLADQPIILPQPTEPKDIIDRLNLFS